MVHVPVEAFDAVGGWAVRHADGSPSDAVVVDAVDGPPHLAGKAVRLTVGAAAGGRVERSFPPVDLRATDDLQLWVRADRPADVGRGFTLELSLGSGASGLDAAANTWRRLLPVEDADRWQPVLLALADLPEPVRAGVDRLRLRVVGRDPWQVQLAALAGLRQELLGDVERALVARLDQVVQIGGNGVRAVVAPDAAPPNQPHVRLRPVAVRPAPERARFGEIRTDFTGAGAAAGAAAGAGGAATAFDLRPAPEPVDLDYAVDAVAAARADQRTLVEMIVAELPTTGVLVVGDRPLTCEWTGPMVPEGEPPVPSAPIRIATARSRPAPPEQAVPPFHSVTVEADSHG
jgi:hypothetical protein